jgi:hypothetical protein
MNKTINVVELASVLAHERMKLELGVSEDEAWVDDTEYCLIYMPEAQDTFNQWYDYYYTQIEQI